MCSDSRYVCFKEGIINIGYIVNEIGRVLSKINEKEEILSNNISQTEKIIKKYTLP